MAYAYTLNAAVPAETDQVSAGAGAIRNVTGAVMERLSSFFTDINAQPLTGANGASMGQTNFVGGTVVASTPVMTITQTWNNAAVVFTAVSLNVINTASDGNSLLMNLKVAGVSQFKVGVGGDVTATGTITGTTLAAPKVSVGAAPALSGSIRLTNNSQIVSRNAGNTNDVNMIAVNGANLVSIDSGAVGSTFGGLATFTAGVSITGGALATGTITKNPANGFTIQAVTGVAFDFSLLNAAGTQGVIVVPVGTSNVQIPNGSLTVGAVSATTIGATGAITISNNAALQWGSVNYSVAVDVSGNMNFATGGTTRLQILNSGAVTVASGLTVSAGGITVSAAGTDVTGNSIFRNNLTLHDTTPAADNTYTCGSSGARWGDLRAVVATLGTTTAQAATALKIGTTRAVAAFCIDSGIDSILTCIDLKDTQASTGGYYISFTNSADGLAGGITHSGTTAVSYTTGSDVRQKQDFRPILNSGNLIDAIEAVDFEFISDPGKRVRGFKAQQLDTVFEEAVARGRTESDMWAVDYGRITPLLVAEIQSLRQRVAELEQ